MTEGMRDDRTGLDENGCPRWIGDLRLEDYCISVVRGIDERQALERIGVRPHQIRPVALDDGDRSDGGRSEVWGLVGDDAQESFAVAVAAGFGDWTLIVEDGGVTACEEDAMAELSRGTEAASCYLSINADTWFTYAVDGEVLVADEYLIPNGTEPARLAAALAAVGVAGRRNDEEEGDDFGLHERVVCALAGLQLTAADFRGRPLLAAPRG